MHFSFFFLKQLIIDCMNLVMSYKWLRFYKKCNHFKYLQFLFQKYLLKVGTLILTDIIFFPVFVC